MLAGVMERNGCCEVKKHCWVVLVGTGGPQEATENKAEETSSFSLLHPWGVPPAPPCLLAKANKLAPGARVTQKCCLWGPSPSITVHVVFKYLFLFNWGEIQHNINGTIFTCLSVQFRGIKYFHIVVPSPPPLCIQNIFHLATLKPINQHPTPHSPSSWHPPFYFVSLWI